MNFSSGSNSFPDSTGKHHAKESRTIKTLCLGFALFFTHPTYAQRQLRDIPPPDPEIEQASFKVPHGFEINLFAADPLLAKPTQISFDRDGRLWVSSSQIYPQLKVNQEPRDRIIILEDSNADGIADRSSVYYDQLIIPGGVLPDDEGGAYVAHAEELIHLSDTDSDGKADKKEVLLSGFGTEDTHHTLHRLSWGPGGLLYMLQGYYVGTHVETLYGPRRLNGGGLWSYNITTRRLEIYSRGLVNPWGMTFDRWGQTFQTDGAGGEGINYSFPDSVFMASPHENHFLRGLNPRRPKSCGIEVISGHHFPESWHGNLVTCDFRANNIDRYLIESRDSGYVSTLQPDLLQSSHVSFRPIDLVMGPDGALYIADWYSPIIQHGEVDFRDERRDQIHGRIWRITAKGRPLVKRIDYKTATVPELLEMLKADENWVRLNAKQALKTKNRKKAIAAIDSWVRSLNPAIEGYEHHRLEALWAAQTLGSVDESLLKQVLNSSAPQARAAGIRVLYDWHQMLRGTELLLSAAVTDPHPLVRREAVTALGQLDSANAVEIAVRVLDMPMDKFLDFALWRTCRLLEKHWLPAFQSGKLNFAGTPEKLAFALKAIEKPEVLAPLIAMLRNDGDAADESLPKVIGKLGSARDLDVLTEIAAVGNHPFASNAALGLLEAAKDRGVIPTTGVEQALNELLKSKDPVTLAAACRLVGLWQAGSRMNYLENKLTDPDTDRDVHRAAAEALARWDQPAVRELLGTIAQSKSNIAIRVSAVAALTNADAIAGAKAAATLLTESLATEDIDELMHAVLVKKDAAEALSRELEHQSLPSAIAIQATRAVEVSGKETGNLLAAIAKAGSLEETQRLMEQDELTNFLTKLTDGDATRGAEIYNRPELSCAVCHTINGSGGIIGPDLSSIGASAPVDYLIESLIDPSTKIKEGYRMSTITTKNGDFYSGATLREDQDVVILRTPVGKEVRVPKKSIESRETSSVSMMPSGLCASLGESEFIDLVKYLSLLGKGS